MKTQHRIRSFADLEYVSRSCKHVLTLFSGGVDSSYVLMELARHRGCEVTALTVDLGSSFPLPDVLAEQPASSSAPSAARQASLTLTTLARRSRRPGCLRRRGRARHVALDRPHLRIVLALDLRSDATRDAPFGEDHAQHDRREDHSGDHRPGPHLDQ